MSEPQLPDYLARLPAETRDLLQRLAVLRWVDRPLFDFLFAPDGRAAGALDGGAGGAGGFDAVTRLPVVRPVNHSRHADRFTVLPDLRPVLLAELAAARPDTFRAMHRLAASYFHLPLSGLRIEDVGAVINELGYLAVAEPADALRRLADFGRLALAAGWLEAASRAAGAVTAAPVPAAERETVVPAALTLAGLADLLALPPEEREPAAAALQTTLAAYPHEPSQPERQLIDLARGTLDRQAPAGSVTTVTVRQERQERLERLRERAPQAHLRPGPERRRYSVRVTNIYATRWRSRSGAVDKEPEFELDRLAEFYQLYRDQLPRVLAYERPVVTQLGRIEPDPSAQVGAAELWLFALPSDQVVAALSVVLEDADLSADTTEAIRVLASLAYGDVELDGVDLPSYIARLTRGRGAEAIDEETAPLPPERHQLVFVRDVPQRDSLRPLDQDVIDRLLYRADPPYRQEFLQVQLPAGLNQPAGSQAAVTQYVSVLYGHPDYVENSVFLSAAQAIGTAARFRQIWHNAYRQVRDFRSTKLSEQVGMQRRQDVETFVDELGNLELDLSFSVETSADLGLLIPSLRIESFHRALYDALELPTRARTVSQMFARMNSSIRSELTAIEVREQAVEQAHRMRRALLATGLGVIGLPLTFLLLYFGGNVRQISPTLSIFDRHYLPVYVLAGIIALLPIAGFLILYAREYAERRNRPDDS